MNTTQEILALKARVSMLEGQVNRMRAENTALTKTSGGLRTSINALVIDHATTKAKTAALELAIKPGQPAPPLPPPTASILTA